MNRNKRFIDFCEVARNIKMEMNSTEFCMVSESVAPVSWLSAWAVEQGYALLVPDAAARRRGEHVMICKTSPSMALNQAVQENRELRRKLAEKNLQLESLQNMKGITA